MSKAKKEVPIESIKSMSFGYSTSTAYLAYVKYDINCKEKCIATIKLNEIPEEEAEEVELDEKKVQEIIEVLNEYKTYQWDGFEKYDQNVYDGNSFHFYLTEQNGRKIHATGYMMYPKNYYDVCARLDEIFESMIKR